jgi:hypothetical protein
MADKISPEALADRLAEVFGSALRAVVLYGSAVAGERIARQSDLNVLVIADDLSLAKLRQAGAATRAWTEAGNPPPLIFTTEEWRGAADVFPMEYADILERHRVLHGALPAESLTVSPANLRRQLEQDARGKLLHLRQAFVGVGEDRGSQLEILAFTVSKLMILYRALLRLHGREAPRDYEDLTRTASELAGFDPAAVLPVVQHVRGSQRIADENTEQVAAGYLVALEQFVRHLDSFHQ